MLAVLITTLASAVQASLGFGAALLAAPLLVLLHPAFVPGPMLASNLVLTLLVVRRERTSIDIEGLRFIVGGRLLGTAPALALLAVAKPALFDALFGVLVLVAVGLSLLRGGVRRSPRNLALAGVASGLMGTLSSIGGPPVALVYQRARPADFRATLGVALIVGATISLLGLWWVGRFAATELQLSALLIPPALAGFWLSRFGILWVSPRSLRGAVLILSSVAALVVLGRALST